LGAAREPDPENPLGVRYAFNDRQFIEVLPLPPGADINRLDHTAYSTENAEGMRKYLAAHAWKTPAKVEEGADGSRWFTVLDPESNKVEFVQPPSQPKAIDAPNVHWPPHYSFRFLVHSRAVEDTFTVICSASALTGLAAWWRGKLDWVSQQTPNGHDWVEYMLVSGPPSQGIRPA